MSVEYNINWPDELKQASQKLQEKIYLIKGYEAKLERVEPEGAEFIETVKKIEAVRDEMQDSLQKFTLLRYKYLTEGDEKLC